MPFILGKDKKIDTLCSEILSEHKKIANIVEEIRIEKDVEDNLNELGELLSSHIRKEERELFQRVQEILSQEQLTILGNELSHLNKSISCK
jgi:hemerythrin-like domain-containing protein